MTNIRRYFKPGQICFLTHVTYLRKPILKGEEELLLSTFRKFGLGNTFELIAWVILPNHFHVVIDSKQVTIPDLIRDIKQSFSATYRLKHSMQSGRLWQYRYWNRIIRNPTELQNKIDYIHYNPVKHELVSDPFAYGFSSIHEFYSQGIYTRDWGCRIDPTEPGVYGE